MLDARDETDADDAAFRPAPVAAEWDPQSRDGVVGVRIATVENDRPSPSEWLWSSTWLDLTAKR